MDCRGQTQPQRAPFETSKLIELGDEIVALCQHLERAPIDDFAGDGQDAAVTDAVEQRDADLILQLLDGLADGRLCREDDLGSLGKTALAHDLDEGAKGSEFHRHSISE